MQTVVIELQIDVRAFMIGFIFCEICSHVRLQMTMKYLFTLKLWIQIVKKEETKQYCVIILSICGVLVVLSIEF